MGFFGFLSGLFNGAAGLGDALSSVISWLVNTLTTVINAILAVLQAIGDFLLAAVQAIGKFLNLVWDKFFKNIFSRVWHALTVAHQWLEDHLRPMIEFLQRLQRWFDRIYARYIRPFLNLIQHIRRFLLILRLLHVKFAQELDAQLSKIEGEIARVFLEARQILNNVVGVLNVVVDPTALLRRPMLIISLRRNIGALIRILTGLPPGYFLPSPSKAPAFGWAPVPANFDPLNPAHNPPASAYLGTDDGVPAFGFVSTVEPYPDSAVDDLELLDFFNDDLWPEPSCKDPVACLHSIRVYQTDKLTHA